MVIKRKIAYFSMEVGLESAIPTYSGGLGVLAGDTLRSAADLEIPLVAVTLLSRKGYFRQNLDDSGRQTAEPVEWDIEQCLEKQEARAAVTIEGRTVHVGCWKRDIKGFTGYGIPVYLLDTDLPDNSEWDRTLTDHLYGGDEHYRICQEVVLGIGGVRILRALGYADIGRFHMNEGHAAFLGLELLDESAAEAGRESVTREDVAAVRKQCVFTTHTPVPAGHDKFPMELAGRVLGRHDILEMRDLFSFEGVLNMTLLALNLSHYVNGVAKKHGEVSRIMYSSHQVDSITNGVHAATWTSPPFQELFDRHIPGWNEDSFSLRYALSIPGGEAWDAHMQAKDRLLDHIREQTGAELDRETLTIGFARRVAAYKRVDLLFQSVDRLKDISRTGRIQIVYSGKAHPRDSAGKELIERIFQIRDQLSEDIKIVFVPDYNMDLGRLITSGVDLWLNTPEPPLEASGTSGMKAALNGVPSLSILDGWWIEGWLEGLTGWAIGEKAESSAEVGDRDPDPDRSRDADSLYDKLEDVIIPMFYNDRDRFINVMLHSIALNGSFFNTQRMVLQYAMKAYL